MVTFYGVVEGEKAASVQEYVPGGSLRRGLLRIKRRAQDGKGCVPWGDHAVPPLLCKGVESGPENL